VFKTYAGWLASRKARDVTRQDIERRHAEVGEVHGPYAANRLLAVVSVVFNASGIDNPCVGVRKYPEPSRERFLTPDELRRFCAALAEQPQPWRDYFGLLLATGFRKSAVCSMRWQDVDLERRTWTVPAHQSKSGKQVVLPLTDEAVTILAARSSPREDSPFVFPSYSASGHVVEPKTAWRALCDAAGLEDVRIHDVRRTRGAFMASAGLSDRQIANALGQATTAATPVYARLREADARAASEAGMALIRAVLNPAVNVSANGE
jgi:integrase